MSWLSGVPVIGGLMGTLLDRIAPDKSKITEAQSRINEIEAGGGPASRLRLWRSFLGWVLALTFAWEIIGRNLLLTYCPGLDLPASVLAEISHLLLGMLGLGL